MRLKYVRTNVTFYLWSDMTGVYHKHVGQLAETRGESILSAGFAVWTIDNHFTCYGESESLGIKSRPEDSEHLSRWLHAQE